MCISWNNKKCFDTVDARCKHEDCIRVFVIGAVSTERVVRAQIPARQYNIINFTVFSSGPSFSFPCHHVHKYRASDGRVSEPCTV